MVVDTLKNIEIYKGLSPDIYAGLKFLAEAKPEIELGVYPMTNRFSVEQSNVFIRHSFIISFHRN